MPASVVALCTIQRLKKDSASLRIYDPFYCEGAVLEHLGALGFKTVINENVDFWERVASTTVPEYDVLLTNPPFSGDHKERILDFCVRSKKPWVLLMPNYVATKGYFQATVGTRAPFFVVPVTPAPAVRMSRYSYSHPEGTGHAESPFDSFWFVDIDGPSSAMAAPAGGVSAVGAVLARSGGAVAVRSVDELRQRGFVPSAKRHNPKQRKKAAARRSAGAVTNFMPEATPIPQKGPVKKRRF